MRVLLLALALTLLPDPAFAGETITREGHRWSVKTTRVYVEADIARPAKTLRGDVLVTVEDRRDTGAWPQWALGAITTSSQYSVSRDVYSAERGVDGAIGALVTGVAKSMGYDAEEELLSGPDGDWALRLGRGEREPGQSLIEVSVVAWWAGSTGNPFAPVECRLALELAFFSAGSKKASVRRSVELAQTMVPFRFGKSIWEQGTEASVPLLEEVLDDPLVRKTLLKEPAARKPPPPALQPIPDPSVLTAARLELRDGEVIIGTLLRRPSDGSPDLCVHAQGTVWKLPPRTLASARFHPVGMDDREDGHWALLWSDGEALAAEVEPGSSPLRLRVAGHRMKPPEGAEVWTGPFGVRPSMCD